MFSGYNKNELDQIRLGNWQEELALKETTGFTRGPKPGDSQFRGSYAQRVIEHTERTEPADYKSTAHGTHIHPSEFKTFVPLAKHGKRAAMLQQTFREAIDEEIKAEEAADEKLRNTFYHETLCAASYTRPPADVYLENMKKLKPKKSDFEAKAAVGDFEAKSVFDDTATTIYADSVSKGDNQFPLTEDRSVSGPFGKTTHFTNDIHDAPKAHADPSRDMDGVESLGMERSYCAGSFD